MRTKFLVEDRPVAVGSIDPMPGSSQIAVFHSAFVLPQYRKHGIGESAHRDRLQAAEDLLYDYAICTVDSKNEFQIKILESNNWKLLHDFYSNKTGHRVLIYGRKLNA